MAASHNPPFGFDASVRSLISAVCLLGLLVLRRFINLVLPPLYSRSMVEGNPTQPHLPPYPPHSSHVKSCLDRPCRLLLTDAAGRIFFIVVVPCTVRNRIQDWFSPPFGAVVVDGLNVGRWTPTRPPRTTRAILDRVCGGYCGLTYSSWTAAGRVSEGLGR